VGGAKSRNKNVEVASGSLAVLLMGCMPRELDCRPLLRLPRRGHQSGHGSGQVGSSVPQKNDGEPSTVSIVG
jgi:hypothetical protein